MTASLSALSLPNCVINSSVMPSLKYSCFGSPLRFWNGSTATMTLPETAGEATGAGGGAGCFQARYPASRSAASAKLTASG